MSYSKQVQSSKCLGITISSDLKWNKQIQQSTAKAKSNQPSSSIGRNMKINVEPGGKSL